jgi:septal ring factor EnvC (AmiA/AmiB activator)
LNLELQNQLEISNKKVLEKDKKIIVLMEETDNIKQMAAVEYEQLERMCDQLREESRALENSHAAAKKETEALHVEVMEKNHKVAEQSKRIDDLTEQVKRLMGVTISAEKWKR